MKFYVKELLLNNTLQNSPSWEKDAFSRAWNLLRVFVWVMIGYCLSFAAVIDQTLQGNYVFRTIILQESISS